MTGLAWFAAGVAVTALLFRLIVVPRVRRRAYEVSLRQLHLERGVRPAVGEGYQPDYVPRRRWLVQGRRRESGEPPRPVPVRRPVFHD